MRGLTRLLIGGCLVAAVGAGAFAYFSRPGPPADSGYATPSVVALDPTATPAESPATLPAAVLLPVPYTDQAPLGNWASKQHTCEEASLVMVDRYLHGDHSAGQIDPRTAEQEINRITPWKPAVDLTSVQVGELAKAHLGWAYQVQPADPLRMREQIALGRPLIIGVRTHGLGNAVYPGYRTHYEQPGWSVSHYIVVVGYDQAGNYVLNDPGITRGHGYHISYAQLLHAIDDLDRAYPNLNSGRVFVVLAPLAV